MRRALLAVVVAGLAGCATTDSNTVRFEGGTMRHETLISGPASYSVTTYGSTSHSREQVEQAFLARARELCGGGGFTHEIKMVPIQTSTTMWPPIRFNSFNATGEARCNSHSTGAAVAIFKDSNRFHSWSKSDFFYLSEIDGRKIEDSRERTIAANRGRGSHMTPMLVQRNVPAQPSMLKIVGRTQHAAPIETLFKDVYQVEGTIPFTPQPYKAYVVRGMLAANSAEVWIEEEATGQRVGETVRMRGSAKLPLLEK
jgi:hypothetical protein